MDSEIMVESLPLLGVCNLCLKEGVVKSMLISQKYNGVQEIYTDMLLKCYSIDMTVMDFGDAKRLICIECINSLREAVRFKEQCEKSLQILADNWRNHGAKPAADIKSEKGDTFVSCDDYFDDDDNLGAKSVTDFKSEKSDTFDSCDEFFDEDDNLALNEYKVKEEPSKMDATNRKSRRGIAAKHLSVKKVDLTETEAMLQSGLFPFKMRKKYPFCCSICPEKASTLDTIKAHIKDHTKTNILLGFKKMKFSSSHRFYKSGAKLRCKLCTTDVCDYEQLKEHIFNCIQLKYGRKWNTLPFKLEKDQLDCPVCHKTFLNYVNLNTHMNVHYPDFICESCGKAFASKARLRGHMRTHEIGSFPCRHCNAVFDRVTKRENHVSKEHKAGVRYACKRCNITLPSFYAKQKHLADVHNEELKRYKCKVCPQSYITPGHLSSHVRRDHLNERNHKCDKCDLAFYTKNALKMHMIKHDGERIHSCHICQKAYQRKKTLREHMRIHIMIRGLYVRCVGGRSRKNAL